ncbi:50S ribosomal protein L9 [Pacificimonas sp. WHA3]|uniref:Large ribosomal subunit protein bL9 n=1 Tax=Pacificimonas pallii TaxID=2827236 RepID=A0ABS6SDD5_9SPHN|nr:50S ribosomal protein L9 [Pacificimonas pallii]MBV7256430.1 50S ribosomal protein L9 [Pacificimonas pallii]
MDIILLERVEKLGNIGDVVSVKPGFARNFLLPKGKALRANEANRARFEADRERIEKENAEKRAVAETDGEKLSGTQVIMIRQSSDSGQLYGSVSARDIATALSEEGHNVDKNQVTLGEPIKTLGIHQVDISLHPEVTVQVEANVARSKEEAEMQAEGIDIFAGDDEEDTMSASERAAAEALARAEAQAEAEARGEIFEEGAGPAEGDEGADGETDASDTAEAESDATADDAAKAEDGEEDKTGA